MKEKKREVKTTPGGGDSIFDAVPVMPNQDVNVSSGPYAETLPVGGTTVGEVRRRYSDRFDIDPNAVSIVNGKPADENYLLSSGESLMFVRHAGEKGGGANLVSIEGDLATVDGNLKSVSMKIEDLCQRIGPGMSTGSVILPAGIKTVLSQGNITIWFWEQPPKVVRLSWIREDSPSPYGPGAKYRNVRIALPYLVIAAVFARDGNGIPNIIGKDECFFRNEPLKSYANDELCFPALLNCSRWSDPKCMGHPLSWICTHHLKPNKQMQSKKPGDRFQGGFEAVRYCLLETSFNLSSEHHEGNSWFGDTKKLIPQIGTVEKWEENTKKDPLFVLDLPWTKTGYTISTLAERIFQQNGGGSGTPKTADDIARIIINQ